MSRKAFDKSAPEDLLEILDFYGIEVFDNGDTQFKPRTMDKFRKVQHDKEVDRLRREVAILEPCVRGYADESKWWTATHSITDESRRHLDVLFAAGVHVMKHGYEPAKDTISELEKVRGEK